MSLHTISPELPVILGAYEKSAIVHLKLAIPHFKVYYRTETKELWFSDYDTTQKPLLPHIVEDWFSSHNRNCTTTDCGFEYSMVEEI